MELYVAEALKQVGEPFSFAVAEVLGEQTYGGRRIAFAEPLRVAGTYVFDGKGFSVEAGVQTVLRSVCARCGCAFDEPFAFPVSERFTKSQEAESDEECYPYAGDRLELTQAVLDNLFLHLPMVSVCRADCKGLCPVCGVNRNTADCQCQPTEATGPFSVLAALSDEE